MEKSFSVWSFCVAFSCSAFSVRTSHCNGSAPVPNFGKVRRLYVTSVGPVGSITQEGRQATAAATSNLGYVKMMRSFVGAGLLALLGFSVSLGAETKGTVKSVDKPGNKIVITVDGGKDTTFLVSKDASFSTVSQVPGKKGKTMEKVSPIDNGLEGIKAGSKVTVLTDTVDEKETVTSVKVTDGAMMAKKKKKKNQNQNQNQKNP